ARRAAGRAPAGDYRVNLEQRLSMAPDDATLTALEKIPSAPRAAQHRAEKETVYLERDCPAIPIPAATSVMLPAGSQVTILEELGGDYTVLTSWGYMARVAGEDADALGRGDEAAGGAAPAAEAFSEEAVWNELRKVYDPEIPVNLVDLGLIYGI